MNDCDWPKVSPMCQIRGEVITPAFISSSSLLLMKDFALSNIYLFIMHIALDMTGWCLWPVKGSLNNQCVNLLKCYQFLSSFNVLHCIDHSSFFWTFVICLYFLFASQTPECCLRGISKHYGLKRDTHGLLPAQSQAHQHTISHITIQARL